jgi:hypothetical protein
LLPLTRRLLICYPQNIHAQHVGYINRRSLIGAIIGHPQKASTLEACVGSSLVAQMVLGFGAGSNDTDRSECETVRDFRAIRIVNTSGFFRAGTEGNWCSIWHQEHVLY